MKVDIKKLDKNKIEVSVEIPAILLESYFKIAVEELSKNLKIKGFRPGKAPLGMAEKEINSQKLYNYTANIAIQKTLPGIIKDNNLEIIGQPEIIVKKIAKGNTMIYQAFFEPIPEIELSEYKGIKIKKEDIKVNEDDIKKSLDYLKKSRTKSVVVNRPAKKGDGVEIDFEIRHNNVKIEDGQSKNHPLILGESKFLPGFEKEIEGMKTGEEKKISLDIPKDWPDKRIAGKKLDFQIKLNSVQKREIPDIDDEFAKSLGNFSSLEELKKSIKEGLLIEKKEKGKEKTRMEIIEKIAQKSKAEIPETLINQEADKMLNDLKNNILNMGLDFETYLQQIKKTSNELKKEWREQAEKRIKIGLCLNSISKKENIDVSADEVEKKINEDLKKYPNIEEVKKNIDLNALKDYTKNILKNEKVFEFLEKQAKFI